MPYQNRGQNIWVNWLEAEKYQSILAGIEAYYTRLSAEDGISDYFTPHDSTHCLAVEKLAKALIKKSNIQLIDIEKFILFVCIWTHDIGMLSKVATSVLGNSYAIEIKRKKHEKIGAVSISTDQNFINIFEQNGIDENLARTFINTINLINKFHRRKYLISKCPKFRYVKGEKIRCNLLATLLRLADTLHIDTTRYDRKKYDILQIGNFDRTSRLHWLKSYVVSAVYLDIDQQTIIVSLDIPEISYNKRKDIEENVFNLKSMIYEDIYEDMVTSQDIFKEYNLPFYSMVNVNVNYIIGMEKRRADEVLGIINDLHILLSPSTSKVIRKSLDSIISLAKTEFTEISIFRNQVSLLLDNLTKIHQHRPCHIGLKRIIDMLRDFTGKIPKVGNIIKIKALQKDLENKVTNIRQSRQASIQEIKNKSNLIESKQYENIILFGISEIVSELLKNCSRQFKEEVNIYIFECGSKRQFSLSNNLEYNDGIQYALLLSNYGLQNIYILPDNAIASLFVDPNINAKKTIVLFGANGIDMTNYACGHSSGHLALAIVAKYFNVPIWIITDTYKFTDKKVREIDWNPTLERIGTLWLTGQKKWIKELEKRKISVKNYREDRIPLEMIDQVITEKKENENPTRRYL